MSDISPLITKIEAETNTQYAGLMLHAVFEDATGDLFLRGGVRAKPSGKRVAKTRMIPGDGGSDPGFWFRFRFFAHQTNKFVVGGRYHPEITTVAVAVAWLNQRAADAHDQKWFMHEGDDTWLSEMFSTIAFQLLAGNLIGARVEGERSYAWRLVEALS